MYRLLVAVATIVVAVDCTTAHAQRHSGKGFRSSRARGANISRGYYSGSHSHYRSPRSSSFFGFSISVGGYPGYGYSSLDPLDSLRYYSYDPYQSGHFEAPDLLKDPYFRARHKFDSHFPGRYRTPLELRPTVPAVTYQPYGRASAYPGSYPVQAVKPNDPAEPLRVESQRLSNSLAALRVGEAWMQYLAPHRISQLVAAGDLTLLRELLKNFDGVVGNPELKSIADAPGFESTRSLLRQLVGQPTELIEPAAEEPAVEMLPLPDPIR